MLPLMLLALATPPALAADDGAGPEVLRIAPLDSASGVSVRQQFVVGPDGGTNLTTLRARYAVDALRFGVAVPFGAYATPLRRVTGLGNLHLDAWYVLDDDDSPMAVGLEAHVGTGSRTWTWANDSRELWPGGGVDIVFQGHTEGPVSWLYRLSAGVHGALEYSPYPGVYARFGGAGGVDWSITEWFGLTAEGALTYWDTSPIEVSALARADIVPGMRARAGLVLPLAAWAGLTPADQPAGIRETTLVIDLRVAR